MTTVLTIEQVVDSFSQGLPMEQRNANFDFVSLTHHRLREGGVWMSPNLGTLYQREGDGFILIATRPEGEEPDVG